MSETTETVASETTTETTEATTGASETTTGIRRSSSGSARRRGSRKPKKSQVPFGIVLIVLMVAFGIFLTGISMQLGLFWLTGICLGFILQKSRFCFTASLRDPYLTGSTSVTRAVLIALAFTTVAFTAIKFGFHLKGLPIPGQSYVVPISLATAVGAFVFGIGAVIAGGCASGILMRVGEGFGMQMLSLLFFVIGSLWGAHDFGWWKERFIINGPKIFMPDIFGWFGAVVIQLVFIFAIYVFADKWENRKSAE